MYKFLSLFSEIILPLSIKVDFSVRDLTIKLTEVNKRPKYNRTWRIDLFIRQSIKLSNGIFIFYL